MPTARTARYTFRSYPAAPFIRREHLWNMKTLLTLLALALPDASNSASPARERSHRAPIRVAQRELPGGTGEEPPAKESFSAAEIRQLERMFRRLLATERSREPAHRPGEHPAEHHDDREVHYHYHYYHRGEHKEEHHTEHHELEIFNFDSLPHRVRS